MEIESDGLAAASLNGMSGNLERGLSSLANVDVENLFGPWMIVDKRYKRSKTILHSDKKKGIVASGSGGSQFAVLDPDVMEDDQGIVRNETYLTSNPSRKSKASKDAASGAKVVPIKPGNSVVVVGHQPTKSFSEHQAVSLLE
ncbi:hypothetical protein V6N12_025552 [Hibiscus sabdariffa]|uniref:Uncharacterized protein n=1 Tax=Hibiscus sabdariffa TaxID=183260 RepID=A0ABR2CIR2_9ROSI